MSQGLIEQDKHQIKMRYNNYQSNEDKPQFNQAALFIERLDKLEGMIDELVATNQITLACDLLKRVIVRIIPLADEKGEDYSDVSKKVEELNNDLTDMNQNLNREAIKRKFSELDGLVWKLQHKLGLIMPKYQKKPWDQEVAGDFE